MLKSILFDKLQHYFLSIWHFSNNINLFDKQTIFNAYLLININVKKFIQN